MSMSIKQVGFSMIDEKAVVVGVTGFEPATSSSRTKHATSLRYTPRAGIIRDCYLKNV